jgi:AAA+ ATPase superfamily predicted ATPase
MKRFPSGVAEGDAFCNRVVERKRLKVNIEGVRHTVLMAPRRYGKTSLIRQVVLENNYIYVWIDFLSVTSKEEVEEKIRKAAKQLLFKLSPELKKITMQTKDLVKSLSPELNLKAMGQSLTLHLTSDSSLTIDEMLLELDSYAQKIGKTAVLICDEFQQISEIEKSVSSEALIRHAVERSKNITYLFSGSNRHLLAEMFSQSNRPLYRLCQAMVVQRIEAVEYKNFLNLAAQAHWKSDLPEEVSQRILALTECHPFYVNALCDELWLQETMPVNQEKVDVAWRWYIDGHKTIILSEVVPLALNQKKILSTLAKQPTKESSGAAFLMLTKLSSSSVRRSLDALLKKDLVYINDQGEHSVLDPAVKQYLIDQS